MAYEVKGAIPILFNKNASFVERIKANAAKLFILPPKI